MHNGTTFAVVAHDHLFLLKGIGDIGDFSQGQMGPICPGLDDDFFKVCLVKRTALGTHQNFPVAGFDDSAG